jgi:hypothetical protein
VKAHENLERIKSVSMNIPQIDLSKFQIGEQITQNHMGAIAPLCSNT